MEHIIAKLIEEGKLTKETAVALCEQVEEIISSIEDTHEKYKQMVEADEYDESVIHEWEKVRQDARICLAYGIATLESK